MLSGSLTASAQEAPAAHPWSFGTTLTFAGGAATSASHTGGLLGLGLGWEVRPWLGIDGSGTWFDRPRGADAFAAALSARAAPVAFGSFEPYVLGGFGLYRASFDASRAALPEFYRRRVGAGAEAPIRTHVFTDPAFTLGGGVNLFLSRHVAVRPEVTGLFVRADARQHVVTAFTVQLAYHFEDHPVTPARMSGRLPQE
jgi:hypothetical protein